MLAHTNTYEGLPTRLYRRPSEISADISAIRENIAEIENMLSVRELMMCIMSENDSPDIRILKLEEALQEAIEALDTLKFLKETLDGLYSELGEVKCLLNI